MANNDPMQIDITLQSTDPLNVSLGEMYKGGDGSFAGLSDVALDNPTNGQVPKYNAETKKWENADDNTVSNLTDLEDVNISNPTDGQIVRYDAEADKFIASDEQVGDSVSVTQSLAQGTKVGEIAVNGQTTELFAPTPTSPTEVSVTQIQSTGTKIATIGVNGTDTDIYAPEGGGGGSSTHYSTEEQVIGTWIDGSTLYQKTIEFTCSSTNTSTTYTMDAGVDIKGYDTRGSWAVRNNHNILSFNCIIGGSASYSVCLSFGEDNGDNNRVVVRHQQKDITNVVVTVIYTKSSS